ncbi:MAG: Lrp/AsnC ligand binding domain-containing protein [Candidatus Bathyarchaeota archaeon]|nr:Lrp/AsnC ligand binding domain-containing protein [Candidatus Bathyarchaeota archaeon]
MPKALVCLTTDLNSTEEVLRKLRACEGVEEAYMVYGIYDIVAKVNGESVDDLRKVLNEEVMGAGKVQKTLAMVVAAE